MPLARLLDTNQFRIAVVAGMDTAGRLCVAGQVADGPSGGPASSTSKVERYDPSTGMWSLSPDAPKKIYQNCFVVDSSDRQVSAGALVRDLGSSSSGTGSPDAFLIDASLTTWSTLPDSPAPGSTSGVFVKGRQMWGLINNPTTGLPKLVSYSGGTSGTWTQHSDVPSGFFWTGASTFWANPINQYALGNAALAPVTTPGLVYLGTPSTSVGMTIYNSVADTYLHSAVAPAGMSTGLCAWDGADSIYFGPGGTGSGTNTAQYWRYDMSTDTYTRLADFPQIMPEAVKLQFPISVLASSLYCAVLGTRSVGPVYTNRIYLYDVVGNTWADSGERTALQEGGFNDGLPRSPLCVRDTVGPGWYLVQGSGPASTASATKIVEYFSVPPYLGVRVARGVTAALEVPVPTFVRSHLATIVG